MPFQFKERKARIKMSNGEQSKGKLAVCHCLKNKWTKKSRACVRLGQFLNHRSSAPNVSPLLWQLSHSAFLPMGNTTGTLEGRRAESTICFCSCQHRLSPPEIPFTSAAAVVSNLQLLLLLLFKLPSPGFHNSYYCLLFAILRGVTASCGHCLSLNLVLSFAIQPSNTNIRNCLH